MIAVKIADAVAFDNVRARNTLHDVGARQWNPHEPGCYAYLVRCPSTRKVSSVQKDAREMAVPFSRRDHCHHILVFRRRHAPRWNVSTEPFTNTTGIFL